MTVFYLHGLDGLKPKGNRTDCKIFNPQSRNLAVLLYRDRDRAEDAGRKHVEGCDKCKDFEVVKVGRMG